MKSSAAFDRLALLLLPALLGSVAFAQTPLPSAFPDKPTNCETNAAHLDKVPQARFQGWIGDGAVIVISRLGDGEYSRELNRRRLFNVRYRLEHYRGLNPQRVVTAEGERTRGYGRVEVYVDGALFQVLVAGRGKDLCVTCCGSYEEFYPERQRRRRAG